MSGMAFIGQQRSRPLLRALFGEALRRNRLAQGRTLADVAQCARVSVPYLSEVERGRKEASSEVLAAVCAALRIELADLLAEVRRDLLAERATVVALRGTRHQQSPTPSPSPATPPRRPGDVVLLAA